MANPIGTVLSAALLLRYSLGQETAARAVEAAVEGALRDGARTADLVGKGEAFLSTEEMTAAILERLGGQGLGPAANLAKEGAG